MARALDSGGAASAAPLSLRPSQFYSRVPSIINTPRKRRTGVLQSWGARLSTKRISAVVEAIIPEELEEAIQRSGITQNGPIHRSAWKGCSRRSGRYASVQRESRGFYSPALSILWANKLLLAVEDRSLRWVRYTGVGSAPPVQKVVGFYAVLGVKGVIANPPKSSSAPASPLSVSLPTPPSIVSSPPPPASPSMPPRPSSVSFPP